ncbi:MAG: hypothetical protein JSS12_02650, partial [Verrucomicrobia bacterium]|nr:hypothetical protein [Verrucomicrobiota bacterium]
LEKIISADWSKDYLTSEGTVASRGYCARAVRFLRDLPFINPIINKYFPKADIYSGCTKVQQLINEIVLDDGFPPENVTIQKAAKKVNELLDHIAQKRPDDAKKLAAARIEIPQAFPKAIPTTTPAVLATEVEDIDSSDSGDEELNPSANLDPFDPIVADEPEAGNEPPKSAPTVVAVAVKDAPVTQDIAEVLKAAQRGTAEEVTLPANSVAAVLEEAAKEKEPVTPPATPIATSLAATAETAVPATPRKVVKRRELQIEEDVAPASAKRVRDEQKEKAKAAKKPAPVEKAATAPVVTTTGRGRNKRTAK